MRASTLRHPRLVASIVVVALLSLVAVGCSAGVAYTSAPMPTSAPTPAPTAVASGAPAATLPPLYNKTADAKADIDAALALAKADGKRVLLDFGADWCPDCHVLAAYLNGTAGRMLVEPPRRGMSSDSTMRGSRLTSDTSRRASRPASSSQTSLQPRPGSICMGSTCPGPGLTAPVDRLDWSSSTPLGVQPAP
jgi:hypothetical protein